MRAPSSACGLPVTTASDIYQAGLVLHELLTGHCAGDVRPKSAEPARVAPPSAALRGTPRCREVEGDLDAIVLKATHPDASQRYASADEMHRDLDRYLQGEPVLARPDSVAYRTRKLLGRRPWLGPLLALVIVGVAAYVATLTTYSARLRSEQQLSAAAQQFMVDLFRSPDPYAPADPARGLDIRVVDALAIGQRRVRSELAGQPELQAALLGAIADVYASLDQPAAAIELREDSLELLRRLHGPRSPQALEALRRLGEHYAASGDLERAGDLLGQQLVAARGEYPPGSPQLALAQLASGAFEHRRGNFAGSRALLLASLASLGDEPGANAQACVDALIMLEQQRSFIDDPLPFDPLQKAESIALTAFGADSLQQALIQVRLASSLTNRGEYEASARIFEATIPVLEARLGPDHASTLGALNNLGYLLHGRKDLAGAEAIHREILRRKLAKHGAEHREVAESYQNLASALTHQGRYDESIPLHWRAHDIFKAVLNADNYVIAVPLLSVAYAELQRDDLAAAEAVARAALERLESAAARTYLAGVARCLVGLTLERRGQTSEGGRLVEAARAELAGASLPDPYPTLCRLQAAAGD
jgi:eukaryotic-like serine/threonine-protein kinase